jgi:nitrogen fixation NifU-like protein
MPEVAVNHNHHPENEIHSNAGEPVQVPPPLPTGSPSTYNEIVMDHFINPRNIGEMSEEEADGRSIIGDPACGDQLKLWIKIKDHQIADIKFKCFGCPGAIATSSMLTVLAKGKTIAEARRLTDNDVIEALGGIPEVKRHCSLIGVGALQQAIDDYQQRQGLSPP